MARAKQVNENENKVTTIEELKQYGSGNIIELPPFSDGQRFFARLKRPSMMGMIKKGKIPNTLLVKANELFLENGAGFDPSEKDILKDMFDLLELMAKETFVEPSYTEIQNAGIELTDEQYMFIFTYAQKGVKALESFRTE